MMSDLLYERYLVKRCMLERIRLLGKHALLLTMLWRLTLRFSQIKTNFSLFCDEHTIPLYVTLLTSDIMQEKDREATLLQRGGCVGVTQGGPID